MSFKNLIYNTYKNIAENVIPTLKNNNFSKTGLLTPKEFIISGDYLVSKFPLWRWSSARKHKQVDYLPKNKQFLILKNIRYNENNQMPNNIENTKENGEWGFYNLTEYEDKNLEDSSDEESEDNNENFILSRTYDVTITYDNYYRTPRIWFFGYDIKGMPMSYEKMLQDFSENHKKVTVTIDKHPFLKVHCVNVHPCKHSNVMKTIIKIKKTNNNKVLVDQYFIYFLKFVACIVPNMDFDFTMSL